MTDFRQLSATVWASPQISLDDVAHAAQLGFTAIINNRPDEEIGPDIAGNAMAVAAAAAGLAYHAIPIAPGGFSREQAAAMAAVLADADGPVLAYCRSGTRSTLLWALARAMAGEQPAGLAAAAEQAGYDLGPIAGALQQLADGADNADG